ncbi:MAG: hypothetical protein IK102_07395 [Treponema sp.]|nr:hypothetical protein [Treponema sp.]
MQGADIKKQLDEIIAAANSGEDFTIISKSPEYSSSGVYRDSAIEIQFSAPVNQSTFSYQILVGGQDVSSINYLEPNFSEDGKIVRIRANSDDLINLEGHSSKDVTVKLSDKLRSQNGSILKTSLLSWTFRVNNSTDDVSPFFASISLNNGTGKNNFTEKAFFDDKGKIAWEDSDFYTNHANKIHFSGIAFDGGSGIDYLTVKETRLRDTKNDIVDEPSIVSNPIYLESDADGNAILDFDYQFTLVNEEYKDGLVKLEIQLTDMCGNFSEVKTFYAIKDTFFTLQDLAISNIPKDIKGGETRINNAPMDFWKNFYWEYEQSDIWYTIGDKAFSSLPEKYSYEFEYITDLNNEATATKYEVTETVTDVQNGIKKCMANRIDFTSEKLSYVRVTAYDETGAKASTVRRIPGKPRILNYTFNEDEPTRIQYIYTYADKGTGFNDLRDFPFKVVKDAAGNESLSQTGSYDYMLVDSEYTLGSTLALSRVYYQKDMNINYASSVADIISGPMTFFTFTEKEEASFNKPVFIDVEYGMDAMDSGTYWATVEFDPNNTNNQISYYVGTGYFGDISIPPEDVALGKTTIHLPYHYYTADYPSYKIKIKASYRGIKLDSDDYGEVKCETDNTLPYIEEHSSCRYSISCNFLNYVSFYDRLQIPYFDSDHEHTIQYFWTRAFSQDVDIYTKDNVKSSFPSRIQKLDSTYAPRIPVCGLEDGNYIIYAQVADNEDDPLDATSPNSLLTLGTMHVATLDKKLKVPKVEKVQDNGLYSLEYNISGNFDYDYMELFYQDVNSAYYVIPASKVITKLSDSIQIWGIQGFNKVYIYACNFMTAIPAAATWTGEYRSNNKIGDQACKDEAFSVPVYVYFGNSDDGWTLSNLVDNNGRVSIITNMPCFVHTLCSYYDYGTDIDQWERRGMQTQYECMNESKNYKIDTSDESGINKGDYYTVIAYFADGNIMQGGVYRK